MGMGMGLKTATTTLTTTLTPMTMTMIMTTTVSESALSEPRCGSPSVHTVMDTDTVMGTADRPGRLASRLR